MKMQEENWRDIEKVFQEISICTKQDSILK
jgi:hypothetical protein